MKPLDPRLLRYAAASRSFLVVAALLGLAQVALVIAFSWLLASILARAAAWAGILGEQPGLGDAALLPELVPALLGLAMVVLGRAALAWAMESVAARAAVKVKSQLRLGSARALAEGVAAGQGDAPSRGSAHAVTVLGAGLDALDPYFSRYLPQLVLTALAIPLHLSVLATQDLTTAVIVALTLPLIPLFMVLIGYTTRTAQQRQWRRLDHLSRTYLDLVEGLATLKVFNRQHHQRKNLRELSEAQRHGTMKVLRVSFLSGFVLDLAASLSVALVAVSVGIRLIDGQMDLAVGLFVLLIVPEAYAPLRQVGTNYHAAAEGVAAAEDVFEILDAAPARGEAVEVPDAGIGENRIAGPRDLVISRLRVERGGVAVFEGLDLAAPASELTVLAGPSGIGKSTLFAAILGFLDFRGTILLPAQDAGGTTAQLSGAGRRELIAWSGQRHGLRSGTILENILMDHGGDGARVRGRTLGSSAGSQQLAREALSDVGITATDPQLSLDRHLGVRGAGLSGGQAHRVAIARALVRARSQDSPVLLLDEPSAALDDAAEARLIRTLKSEAAAGRTVVVISHRRAFREAADRVIDLATTSSEVRA
ncbi:thiol reductant ABC exporter subunit CydD [Nesterenkonia sp. E16_7]|uniref:thiol reductant ABC exporter subunit CydD n=1 Tax=unclassified Nesterenkonia TaxID=2629769 RepID=UPI001A93491B|nr:MULTISPECIES: thiol reductant ABC exporter subunit CydD [unclassified Nesterenkonia]MBO0595492.1 thiol reductant ABC exporter subunit CydD [Nesterenkonia sp. E16_10]MBO0599062.1 thiol reductant ABC exporter subunit CydD [Nesterenkonia sp. E16_7]